MTKDLVKRLREYLDGNRKSVIIIWRKQETRAQRVKRAGTKKYFTFVFWNGEMASALGL